MKKWICLVLAIFFILLTAVACNYSNDNAGGIDNQKKNSNAKYLESGFSGNNVQEWKALFCAYKIEERTYNIDENINLTIFFGASDDRNMSHNNESKTPIYVAVRNNDSNEKVVLHEFSVDDLFVDKYLVFFDEASKKMIFNFNEQISLPKSLLTNNKGSISIIIEHIPDEDVNTLDYGCSMVNIYYVIENNNIYLSTQKTIN